MQVVCCYRQYIELQNGLCKLHPVSPPTHTTITICTPLSIFLLGDCKLYLLHYVYYFNLLYMGVVEFLFIACSFATSTSMPIAKLFSICVICLTTLTVNCFLSFKRSFFFYQKQLLLTGHFLCWTRLFNF